MFHHTARTLTILALVTGVGLAAGCGSTQSTADSQTPSLDAYVADGSLGAGDALGAQVFATDADATVRMAILRDAERAFAIAEAQEANGTYDAWYASFERPSADGTAIAAAEEDASEDQLPDEASATVPVDPE
jgi:hypothetical protein